MDIKINDNSTKEEIQSRLTYLNRQTEGYKSRAREYQLEYSARKRESIAKLHITDQFAIYEKQKEAKVRSYEKMRDQRRKAKEEAKLNRIHELELELKISS